MTHYEKIVEEKLLKIKATNPNYELVWAEHRPLEDLCGRKPTKGYEVVKMPDGRVCQRPPPEWFPVVAGTMTKLTGGRFAYLFDSGPQMKKLKVYKMKLTSSPVKAGPVFWKPKPPTGPDPIKVHQYLGSCGTRYNAEGRRRTGWKSIPVLEFLKGRKVDEVVMSYIHALRPSSVRISEGMLTCDASVWRVTVMVKRVKRDLYVESVTQEVEVLLPEGVAHGDALNLALHYGIDSPEVKWHEDADSYHSILGSHGKTKANGEMVPWNFKPRKKPKKLWRNLSKSPTN